MAKLVVEFDTEDKKMSVNLDGEVLNHVVSVHFISNKYGDNKDGFEIYTKEPEKDGICKHTSVVANKLFNDDKKLDFSFLR